MQLAGHSLRSTGQLASALPFPASAPSPGEITRGTDQKRGIVEAVAPYKKIGGQALDRDEQ